MGAADNYANLVAEFRRRFPLLDKIMGLFGKDIPVETVPWFFGFFLAAAERREPGACCFVLDKKSGTTAITSVLTALIRFKEDFPDLAKSYTRTSLSTGDRVKIKPDNLVYEYDGFWEEFGRLKLKVLDKQEWRSFPVEEILRLEPTLSFKPKGKGGPSFSASKKSPLDHLLSLHSYGNKSLIKNTALVLMEQTAFEKSVDSVVLTPPQMLAGKFHELSSFLPWGSVGEDGILKSKDKYQVEGEPLIAVTSAPEYLSYACLKARPATKTVFVDGAKRFSGNLQAFDDIAERQNMIILATPDEREHVDQLRERGCTVWKMLPEEILIGENSARPRVRASLVGATVRAATVRLNRKIIEVDCEDTLIQRVAVSLERAMEVVRNDEESSEAVKIVRDLRNVLFDCSECCFGISDTTVDYLAEAKNHFAEHEKYLEEDARSAIDQAIDGLEHLVKNGGGQNKAEMLQDILSETRGRWVVAARSARTAECLREKLGPGNGFEVKRFSEISLESEYAGIIVPAWPYKRNFVKLIGMAVAPDIRVLVYPFEKNLVLFHKKQEERLLRSGRIGMEKRSSILGIEPGLLPEMRDEKTGGQEVSRREMEIKESSLLDFENRIAKRSRSRPIGIADDREARETRAVHFFGGCHAFLTEWAQLPVLNELVYKSDEENPRLLQKTPAELSPGDFVLFRAGGDKEFVRLVAERILGEEEYTKTRRTTELWKSALRVLGESPEAVRAELVKHGLKRSLPTLANWLRSPYVIAPQIYGDIEVIARAAGHDELLLQKEEITLAIKTIREAHRSAGRELSRLILGGLRSSRLGELDEQPVLQDFGYGEAWIVQVELVEPTLEMCGAGEVNRLLWSDD